MRNYPLLNSLAIWEPVPHEGLYSKRYESRRTYKLSSGIIKDPTPQEPIIAYAKNYTKGKKDFCLFMYSDSQNEKAVEEFMDKAIKSVKVADVSEALVIATTGGFKYTTQVFKEDN